MPLSRGRGGVTTNKSYLQCSCSHLFTSAYLVGDWLVISKNYEEKCDLPHEIGAIDGQHIQYRWLNKPESFPKFRVNEEMKLLQKFFC